MAITIGTLIRRKDATSIERAPERAKNRALHARNLRATR
jgi:hypothetical protein